MAFARLSFTVQASYMAALKRFSRVLLVYRSIGDSDRSFVARLHVSLSLSLSSCACSSKEEGVRVITIAERASVQSWGQFLVTGLKLEIDFGVPFCVACLSNFRSGLPGCGWRIR